MVGPKGISTGFVHALTTILVTLLFLGPFQRAEAQPQVYDPTPRTIQYIYQNQNAYDGRSVSLPGPVYVRSVDTSGSDRPPSFAVQDQNGTGLRVYTTGELPQIYEPYRISGTVQLREGSQTPYLVANSIEGPVGGTPLWLYVAISVLLLFIGALCAYVFVPWSDSSPQEARPATRRSPPGEGSQRALSSRDEEGHSQPEPASTREAFQSRRHARLTSSSAVSETRQQGVREGKMVRAEAPPSDTVKMLGHLEVLSAPNDPDIPLIVPPGDSSTASGYEFTLGRRSAPTDNKFGHIQLKPRTVSREQAKLSFMDGSFRLTNYVSEDKNPTAVEGEVLGLNEQVNVSDGDIIKMGEVRLRLHTAPRA